MGLIRLFTSFDGRIGRRSYWFGLLAIILASPFSFGAVWSADPFREAYNVIQNLGVVGLGWTLALFVPLAALNTKRLHDLGKTGLTAVVFYLPAALSAFTLFTGWDPQVAGEWVSWGLALAGVVGVTSAWFLYKLGFSGGTSGPNKYGPDPSG